MLRSGKASHVAGQWDSFNGNEVDSGDFRVQIGYWDQVRWHLEGDSTEFGFYSKGDQKPQHIIVGQSGDIMFYEITIVCGNDYWKK